MFCLRVLTERLPLTPIFQNMTFIHYVRRLMNVTKIAKFNLLSILGDRNPIVLAPLYMHVQVFVTCKSSFKTSAPYHMISSQHM